MHQSGSYRRGSGFGCLLVIAALCGILLYNIFNPNSWFNRYDKNRNGIGDELLTPIVWYVEEIRGYFLKGGLAGIVAGKIDERIQECDIKCASQFSEDVSKTAQQIYDGTNQNFRNVVRKIFGLEILEEALNPNR